MFFIMSGFVMMLGYGGKGKAPVISCGYGSIAREFLLRRVARMGPCVWFSLLACVPLSAKTAQVAAAAAAHCSPDDAFRAAPPNAGSTVFDYLVTASFVQNWVGAGAANGPLWSTCAQMFCYLLFPFFVGALHTVRSRARALGEALLWWLVYVVLWVAMGGSLLGSTGDVGTAYIVPHVHPLNKIGLFCLGMLCGSLALTNAALAPSQRSRAREARWGAVAACCFVFVAFYFMLGLTCGWQNPDGGFLVRFCGEMFNPPVYALWLFSLTQAPDCAAARLLCWRPFRTLGDWSFALYCLHFPTFTYYAWMRFGDAWFDPSQQDALGKDSLRSMELLPALALVFAVSAATYHYVEKPTRARLATALQRVFPSCGPCGRVEEEQDDTPDALALEWQATTQRLRQLRPGGDVVVAGFGTGAELSEQLEQGGVEMGTLNVLQSAESCAL